MFSQAALNASLNGASAVLLAGGYAAIRNRKIAVHKVFMISAFTVSSIFLVSYVIYHVRVGSVHFQGQGWIRPFYFLLLGSHTILAVVIVPMILITLRRAWREQFDKHRLIARWTLPLWFYVSITGVIVYILLYQLYAPTRHARTFAPQFRKLPLASSLPPDLGFCREVRLLLRRSIRAGSRDNERAS